MPQNLKIPSPFDFVPFLDRKVERGDLKTYQHQRFTEGLRSGELQFRLENLKLLLIASGRDEQGFPKERNAKKEFVHSQGKPIIPGSSLKGMFRSVYELVTHSCLWMISDFYRQTGLDPQQHEPLRSNEIGIKRCEDIEKLCPACRLFGFMSRTDSWKGRINIGDGILQGEPRYEKHKAIPVQGQPRPKARPNSDKYMDYLPKDCLAGRKLYYHWSAPEKTVSVPKDAGRTGQRPIAAEPLAPGNTFEFTLKYTNLEEVELAVLLESILLRSGWAHHLGTGKSYGWGSCKIELIGWKEFNPTQRYQQINAGLQTLNEAERVARRHELAQYLPQETFDSLEPFMKWDDRENKNYGFYNPY